MKRRHERIASLKRGGTGSNFAAPRIVGDRGELGLRNGWRCLGNRRLGLLCRRCDRGGLERDVRVGLEGGQVGRLLDGGDLGLEGGRLGLGCLLDGGDLGL